jgi:hypothetical protein
MKQRTYQLIKNIFILALTIFILGALFSNIDILAVTHVIKNMNQTLFFFALFISLISNILICSDRFRRILKSLGCSISFKGSLFLKTGSSPLKLLPLSKSNQLAEVLYLKKCYNLNLLTGISALIFSLTLNLCALLLFISGGVIMLLMSEFKTYKFISTSVITIIVVIIYLLFFCLVIKSKKIQNAILYVGKKLNTRIHDNILQVISIYNNLTYSRLMQLLIYSILLVSSELVIFYLLAESLHLSIPFYAILFFVPITIILSNLPITISGLGVRESAFLFFLSTYALPEKILSLGLLISFVGHLFPVLIGIPLLVPFLNRISNLKIDYTTAPTKQM